MDAVFLDEFHERHLDSAGFNASDSPRRNKRGTVAVLCVRLRIAPGLRWVRPFHRSATSSFRLNVQPTRWVMGSRQGRLESGSRVTRVAQKLALHSDHHLSDRDSRWIYDKYDNQHES